MNKAIVPVILALLLSHSALADAIRYDQIPADASAFVFVDVDRVLSTEIEYVDPVLHTKVQMAGSQSISAELNHLVGGPIASGIVYSLPRDETSAFVALLHADHHVRQYLETEIISTSDVLQIKYQNQNIYCVHSVAAYAALGMRSPNHKVKKPSTQRVQKSMLQLGFSSLPDPASVASGLYYIAFLDQQLIVAATDLPAIAEALDVIAGKKSSLANQDPHHIKFDLPSGTMFAAAGLSAQATVNPNDLVGKPSANESQPSAPFDLNLFGALEGKARLARMDAGMDEQSMYVNAAITMSDNNAAEQLKNLIVGVKALLSLSQEKKKPLFDPLEVQSAGKTVELHWSWPMAKLSELVRLLGEGEHDGSMPTTAPAAK